MAATQSPKPARAVVVLSTAPNRKTARKITRILLIEKLAACVSILPGCESHYFWKGKMERANEVPLVIKTTPARAPALRRRLTAIHPYDCPEVLMLPVLDGHPGYLKWLADSVGAPPKGKKR